MYDDPAVTVACPVCGASPGEPCDEPVTHLARQDEAGDPGPGAALDGDGDGVDAWQDLDDPAGWM